MDVFHLTGFTVEVVWFQGCSAHHKLIKFLIYLSSSFRKRFVFVFIVEGLAVGVGFGAIGKSPSATFESAR